MSLSKPGAAKHPRAGSAGSTVPHGAGSSASPGATQGPCLTAGTVLPLPVGFLAGRYHPASGSASEFCWQKQPSRTAISVQLEHLNPLVLLVGYLGSGFGRVG